MDLLFRAGSVAKVFFFEFWHSSPHLGTAFELAQSHLDNGDEVCFYFGGHELTYCGHTRISPDSKFVKYGLYELPEIRAASLVTGDRFYFYPRMNLDKNAYRELSHSIESLEELKEYSYGDYKAGLSVLSSLVSKTRCSAPSFSAHADIIETMLCDGERIYEFVRAILTEISPDLVYVFNGRFYESRAVLDAARSASVQVKIHERGGNLEHYSLREFMPHDRFKIEAEMHDRWELDKELPNAREIARSFFVERRQGVEQAWKSYTVNQSKDLLPDFNPDMRVVTYFSSSDDEYVAVGDIYKWENWENQFQAVEDLIAACRAIPDIQLIVRIHPHLSEKSEYDRRKWLSLEANPEVAVVHPESPVDSYALIEASDIVVTAGSTVGIEAVFWGTPSINLGPSLYSRLRATYQPGGARELTDLLLRSDLVVKSELALPYGYYASVFGTPHFYYKSTGVSTGRFKGVDFMKVPVAVSVIRRARKVVDSCLRTWERVRT